MEEAFLGLGFLGLIGAFICFAISVIFIVMWIVLCRNVGDIRKLLFQIRDELSKKEFKKATYEDVLEKAEKKE